MGGIIATVGGTIAFYLNIQGYRCLSQLARVNESIIMPEQLEEMDANCSVITNSYIYSLYSVIAGIALVLIGLVKRRSNPSWAANR